MIPDAYVPHERDMIKSHIQEADNTYKIRTGEIYYICSFLRKLYATLAYLAPVLCTAIFYIRYWAHRCDSFGIDIRMALGVLFTVISISVWQSIELTFSLICLKFVV